MYFYCSLFQSLFIHTHSGVYKQNLNDWSEIRESGTSRFKEWNRQENQIVADPKSIECENIGKLFETIVESQRKSQTFVCRG